MDAKGFKQESFNSTEDGNGYNPVEDEILHPDEGEGEDEDADNSD